MQLAPRQLDLFRQPKPEGAVEVPQVSRPEAAAEPPRSVVPSHEEAVPRAKMLAQALANYLGPAVKVHLLLHDNRSTMVSFRRQPPLLRLRLHHMFLDAPLEVVHAIADYSAHGKRDAGQQLDAYIASQQERIRALPRAGSLLESRGACFDLADIYERVNREHFENGITARIGWGRNSQRRQKRKSIRLGVYDHKSREIRIHPVLDRPDVPLFFVEFIVFHEMLHQLFPSEGGTRVHHPRAFRVREKSYPKYDAAMVWEREHLRQLLNG